MENEQLGYQYTQPHTEECDQRSIQLESEEVEDIAAPDAEQEQFKELSYPRSMKSEGLDNIQMDSEQSDLSCFQSETKEFDDIAPEAEQELFEELAYPILIKTEGLDDIQMDSVHYYLRSFQSETDEVDDIAPDAVQEQSEELASSIIIKNEAIDSILEQSEQSDLRRISLELEEVVVSSSYTEEERPNLPTVRSRMSKSQVRHHQ